LSKKNILLKIKSRTRVEKVINTFADARKLALFHTSNIRAILAGE
jgi:hypothetical protein